MICSDKQTTNIKDVVCGISISLEDYFDEMASQLQEWLIRQGTNVISYHRIMYSVIIPEKNTLSLSVMAVPGLGKNDYALYKIL